MIKIYLIAHKVVCNKERCKTLAIRVRAIEDSLEPLLKDENRWSTDKRIIGALTLFKACIEDIYNHITRLTNKNRDLAIRILKVGTDESQFVSLNERLQHCVSELQLAINVAHVFNQDKDDEDFKRDMDDLKSQQQEILALLYDVSEKQDGLSDQMNSHKDDIIHKMQKEMEKLASLIKHQAASRSTYRTKRSPAALNIESGQLGFDEIIGKGGFGVVWKGTFQGHTVMNLI